MSVTDPALATLWLPFIEQQLNWPATEATLFLRARGPLPEFAQALTCVQSYKPAADQLLREVITCATDSDLQAHYSLVLLLPPRQREEARALLARAVQLAAADGVVLLSAANNEGARGLENDLAELTGNRHSLSKHKCRAVWSHLDGATLNQALLRDWLALDAPRPIEQGRFISRPGVFAWDHIDPASALLVQQLPSTLRGRAADLGTGFGYLAYELLQRCPGITALDVYEAEARALQLAQQNLRQCTQPIGFHWHDITQGLHGLYDVIITNPPFHAQERTDRPDIGQRFISVAAAHLKPGGQLWLVANRHLPYEHTLNAQFGSVAVAIEHKGFKIIHARKAVPALAASNNKPLKTARHRPS